MSKRTAPVTAVPPIAQQAAIPVPEGPVSFRSFQSELATLSAKLQHKDATSPPSADTLQLHDLSLDDAAGEDDDGRTLEVGAALVLGPVTRARMAAGAPGRRADSNALSGRQDRLTNPNPTSSAGIAALIARHLALNHGELVVQVAEHNLKHKTVVSLLEDPDTELPLDFTAAVLPRATVDAIVATLSAIANDIDSELSVAFNPFDEAGRLSPAVTPVGATVVPSCVNEEAVEARWRGRALRLLVRRRPETAQDIQESRVAVVGNVVSGS